MAWTTDILMTFRRIIKLHESGLKELCEKYRLSLIEANIISFLYNNPGKDTAGDIVELRMLAKGNVSQGGGGLDPEGAAPAAARMSRICRKTIYPCCPPPNPLPAI